jgi:hypothetical protein
MHVLLMSDAQERNLADPTSRLFWRCTPLEISTACLELGLFEKTKELGEVTTAEDMPNR